MGDIADFLVRISEPDANAAMVYDGSRPEVGEVDHLCHVAENRSYVYMFATNGEATYIGMTRDPGTRLRKHRSRSWHPATDGLVIVSITTEKYWRARLAALHTEAQAIRMFGPTENVAGGDRFGT